MKNLLDYYNASKANKIKIYILFIIGYFLIYASAQPQTFTPYVFQIRTFITSSTGYLTKLKQNFLSQKTGTNASDTNRLDSKTTQ
jgi:hypothetical protein